MSDARGRAIAVLLAGACIIGLAPILVRLAGAGPAATGFWRLLFSVPMLALLSRNASGRNGPGVYALAAGVAFALDLAFWHYGITNTSVSKATVLANLTPLVVTAIVWMAYGQRPAPLFLLAVLLSVGGAAVMAIARGAGASGPNPLLGDTLSLLSSGWYALYFLAMSAARRRESASRAMLWSSIAGTPLLLLAARMLGERLTPPTVSGWTACIGLGAVHVGGQGAIAWALGRLPPATAAVTVLVQPVVTTALGWVLFHELLSRWQTVGAVLALAGVVLAQRASQPAGIAREAVP